MDEEEAKAKGLLKIIGNKEVDDDYIAQVKTLCIQPELLAEEGSKLSIVYTPIHGSGNVPVRRILREVGISNVSVVKEQELPDPNFSTVKVPNPEDPGAFVLPSSWRMKSARRSFSPLTPTATVWASPSRPAMATGSC